MIAAPHIDWIFMPAAATPPPVSVDRPELGRIDAVVHLSFALLMVTSGVRYVLRHSPADNVPVLILVAAVCTLYAGIAVLAQRRRPWTPWVFTLVVGWAALVILAPSFAWSSLAVFFLCRAAFSGWAAYLAGGATAVSTAIGLFRLSGSTDVAMLLGPLAAGGLLTLVYDRMEHDTALQRQLAAEVSDAQQQLAASARDAGIAAERERVSREIHDTVTQGLASGVLLLEAALRTWPDPAARTDISRAGSLLRQNLADTRSLVHELSVPRIDAPLAEALLEAASLYLETVQVKVTGEARPVPADVRHALLRVTQSAAANIRLHADAGNTSLTLGYLPCTVTLDVYDDGRGFDPGALAEPSESGGYGLRAMRQRVEQLGGVFAVESVPGEGTIVAAQLPVPATGQAQPAEVPGEVRVEAP
jgi:signal transduction histidine kinase